MKYPLLLVILCLFTVHGLPQAPDHQNSLASFDFLLGSWNVDVDARLSAQGPWEKSKATSTIRKTLNSSLIEEDFQGTRENRPFLIKTLFAINNSNNKYQRVFADSEHGVLIEFEGEKTNDSLCFDKTWVFANHSAVRLRVIYHIISNDEFVIDAMRMPQQATDWDVTARMKYTRRK